MGTLESRESPLLAETTAVLRFSCRHCAMELTAPLSVAEVEGPCPGCGGLVQAPSAPIEEEVPSQNPDSGPQRGAESPEEVEQSSPAQSPQPSASAPSKVLPSPASEQRVERKVRKRRRKPAPEDSLERSMEAEERREVRALLKIVLAVLATVVIVMVVSWVVRNGMKKAPVSSDPEEYQTP